MGKTGSELVVGKNVTIIYIFQKTLIKRVLLTRASELETTHPLYEELKKFGPAIKELDALKNLIEYKVGFVFTNEPVFDLRPIIEANKV